MVEPHAQTFTDGVAREALRELRELDRAGRPLAQGSRALLPCACRPPWAGVAPHRPEAVPGSPWRVLWRCEGCGHAKGEPAAPREARGAMAGLRRGLGARS